MRTAGAFLASARSLRVANTAAEISPATSPILNGLFISFDSHFDRQTLGTHRGLTRRPVVRKTRHRQSAPERLRSPAVMDGADAERNSTATRDGPFLSPRSALALAANGLPHERTKSIAPQLLASVGAAQRPRPWLLCDSKPRLVGGRTLPCSATCIFNWRWRLLIPSLVGAQERLSVARHPTKATPNKRGATEADAPFGFAALS